MNKNKDNYSSQKMSQKTFNLAHLINGSVNQNNVRQVLKNQAIDYANKSDVHQDIRDVFHGNQSQFDPNVYMLKG